MLYNTLPSLPLSTTLVWCVVLSFLLGLKHSMHHLCKQLRFKSCVILYNRSGMQLAWVMAIKVTLLSCWHVHEACYVLGWLTLYLGRTLTQSSPTDRRNRLGFQLAMSMHAYPNDLRNHYQWQPGSSGPYWCLGIAIDYLLRKVNRTWD